MDKLNECLREARAHARTISVQFYPHASIPFFAAFHTPQGEFLTRTSEPILARQQIDFKAAQEE
jgi:hypothetical protein